MEKDAMDARICDGSAGQPARRPRPRKSLPLSDLRRALEPALPVL